MNNLITNLFNFLRPKSSIPQSLRLTESELKECLLETTTRMRGLRSAEKHYLGMIAHVKGSRKVYYAQLKDAAHTLLNKEEVEMATLENELSKSFISK